MCLSSVTKNEKPLVGYKCLNQATKYVYYYNGGKWEDIPNIVNAPCRDSQYEIGKWYMSNEIDQISADDNKKYYVGFHIFKTKRAAEASGYGSDVYKVEYLGQVSEGKEDGRVVVTALAMRVVGKV